LSSVASGLEWASNSSTRLKDASDTASKGWCVLVALPCGIQTPQLWSSARRKGKGNQVSMLDEL